MSQNKSPDNDGRLLTRLQIVLCLLLGAILVVCAALGVSALSSETTNEWTAPEGSTLDAADGPEVELGTDVEDIDRRHPIPGDGSVDLRPEIRIEASDGTSVRYDGSEDGLVQLEEMTLNGEATLTHGSEGEAVIDGNADRFAWQDPDLESDQTDLRYGGGSLDLEIEVSEGVRAVDTETGETIEIVQESGGSVDLSLEDTDDEWTEITLLSSDGSTEIDTDSASPVGPQSDLEAELSVDVSDPDGGSVDVEFEHNGQTIGTDTIDGSGTASIETDETVGGSNSWSVQATDEFGAQSSETFEFAAPSDLEIRDEQTEELIESADGEEAEVRFFPEGDDELVETRTTTDGVVDFTGLPIDEEFIITVNTDGYGTRSIYIDSVLEQQTVYLLSNDVDSSLITFSLDDRTESFPDDDTRLIIQKPIGSENTEYRNIAGEYFGADGEQSVTLENGERYRLSVENRNGQSRSLGAFTPETDDIITLETGQVDIGPPDDGGYVFSASTEGEDDSQEVRVSYRDEDNLTDRVDYRIVEQFNESNVLQDWVSETDVTEFQDTIPIEDDSTNWVVEYEIDRDGETITDSIPVGGVGSFNWPLNPQWLHAFGLFAIVGTASLFGGSMSRTGALVVSIMAFGLTTFGVLAIPYPMLMLAGVVAVLFKFAERGDGGGFV